MTTLSSIQDTINWLGRSSTMFTNRLQTFWQASQRGDRTAMEAARVEAHSLLDALLDSAQATQDGLRELERQK